MQCLENVLEDWASSLALCGRTLLEEIGRVCLSDPVRTQTRMAHGQPRVVGG